MILDVRMCCENDSLMSRRITRNVADYVVGIVRLWISNDLSSLIFMLHSPQREIICFIEI